MGELQKGSAVAADPEQPGTGDHTARSDAAGVAIELGPPFAAQLIERVLAIAAPPVPGHVIAVDRERIPTRAPAGPTPIDGSRVVVEEPIDSSAGSQEIATDRLGGAEQRHDRRATHGAATNGNGSPTTAHTAPIPTGLRWRARRAWASSRLADPTKERPRPCPRESQALTGVATMPSSSTGRRPTPKA